MSDTILTRPIAFRVLIDEAMKQVRRHFRAIYPTVAIPLAAVQTLLAVAYTKRMAGLFDQRAEPSLAAVLGGMADFGFWFLLWVGLYALGSGVLQVASLHALSGREINMKRSFLFMLRPRVVGTYLLVALCCAGSLLFCVLPVIYVFIVLSFVTPILVEEQLHGRRALRRSVALARYNPRLRFMENPSVKVFGLFLVVWLLSYAVNTVVQLPLIVTQQILMLRSVVEGEIPQPGALMESMLWLQVASGALSSLASSALQLYGSFGLGLLFFDVRRRREGADLEAAFDALGAPPAPSPVEGQPA